MQQPDQKYRLLLWLILSVSFLCPCYGEAPGFLILGADKIIDSELKEVIIHYYEAESEHAWNVSYPLRGKSFKHINKNDYIREMDKGMKGWILQKIEILNIVREDPYYSVRIRFYEKITTEIAESKFHPEVLYNPEFNLKDEIEYLGQDCWLIKQEELTYWILENSGWNGIRVGRRGHLPLNHQPLRGQ